jgi:hypothetical protein
MKPDERDLLLAVFRGDFARYAGVALGIPAKRVEYLCQKWTDRGWYDYGIAVDTGWLTTAGRQEVARLAETPA